VRFSQRKILTEDSRAALRRLSRSYDLGAREPYGLFRLDMNKMLAIERTDEAAAKKTEGSCLLLD
jgi:hypothetical protein